METKMNITSKILAVTAVAAMSFAGVSHAAGTSDRVSVTLVQSIEDTAYKSSLEGLSNDEIANAQTAVESEPGLADVLKAKNVQLNNVVKVQKFSDGSASVFVR
jgi:hypothetical protein